MGAPAGIRPVHEVVSTLRLGRRWLCFWQTLWHLETITFVILHLAITTTRLAYEIIQRICIIRGICNVGPGLFLCLAIPNIIRKFICTWLSARLINRIVPYHADKRPYSMVDLIRVVDHAGRMKPDLLG